VVAAVIPLFVGVEIHSLAAIVYFGAMASLMLSLLGMLGGIWADKFDHMAAVTNFIITPLSFLSGTFYSITRLPEPWRQIAQANPFFHLIDGFRYGFIGHADGNLMAGAVVVAAVNAVLLTGTYWMIRTGYKLRA
jgi:ABC-2 type transport system permease protein